MSIQQEKSKNQESGVALIAAVLAVTILMVIGVSFAFNMRLEEKAAFNFMNSVRAGYIAKAGIDRAIAELRNDTNEPYDYLGDTWSKFFATFGHPLEADRHIDLDNADGDDNEATGKDAVWSTSIVIGGNDLFGRYAIYVVDEASKVNINASGNIEGVGDAHAFNLGWSTFEISLENFFAATGILTTYAADIVRYRRGNDGFYGATTGDDNPTQNPEPANDVIDNDGDGTPDPGDTGEEETQAAEFNLSNPGGDDGPFQTIEELKNVLVGIDYNRVKGYITAWSYDVIQDGGASDRININQITTAADIGALRVALEAGGLPLALAIQIAVNVKDFVDTDDDPTAYTVAPNTYYGIEQTAYLNEVEADPPVVNTVEYPPGSGLFPSITDYGEFIELFNPYPNDVDISGYIVAGVTIPTIPTTILAAGGFYTIGDTRGYVNGIDTSGLPGYPLFADLYADLQLTDAGVDLTLINGNGFIIEVTNFGSTGATDSNTRQKNDPRLRDSADWSTAVGTLGIQNTNFNPTGTADGLSIANWQSSFEVWNAPFANIGELGYVHGAEAWTSVIVRYNAGINDGAIFDYITVTDPRRDGLDNDGDVTIDEDDEIKVYGRININTAPREVLLALPGVVAAPLWNEVNVDDIINDRNIAPFQTIGDIFNVLNFGNPLLATDNDGDGYNNEDDEYEAVFRNLSNLITVRSNVFTVWVIAEVWRDLDGGGSIDSADEKLAEKKIRAVIDRGMVGIDPIKTLYWREVTE